MIGFRVTGEDAVSGERLGEFGEEVRGIEAINKEVGRARAISRASREDAALPWGSRKPLWAWSPGTESVA